MLSKRYIRGKILAFRNDPCVWRVLVPAGPNNELLPRIQFGTEWWKATLCSLMNRDFVVWPPDLPCSLVLGSCPWSNSLREIAFGAKAISFTHVVPNLFLCSDRNLKKWRLKFTTTTMRI